MINVPNNVAFLLWPLFRVIDSGGSMELVEGARRFFEERNLHSPPLVTGQAQGWRHRAKLVVAPSRASPCHPCHPISIHPTAPVLIRYRKSRLSGSSPSHTACVSIIQQVLGRGIPPYDEARRSGLLRYLLLALEEETKRVQVSFVVTERHVDRWQSCLQRLMQVDSSLWHSMWLNQNARADNVIWGETWDLLWGQPWLHTQVGMASMALHPGCFFQANVPLFRALVDELTCWVPAGCRLLELYSGCGVMGLHLAAARHCRVVLCERNPLSRLAFEASLARMPFEVRQRLQLQFIVESAENALFLLEEAEGVEAVLVDPPRKGLPSTLIAALKKCLIGTHLFYISCGWKAFMRDCDALCATGWQLKRAKSYLFFPGTNQIELLVHFQKFQNAKAQIGEML